MVQPCFEIKARAIVLYRCKVSCGRVKTMLDKIFSLSRWAMRLSRDSRALSEMIWWASEVIHEAETISKHNVKMTMLK